MTDMMNVNPLMDFARKVECSVKLPSQGVWYDDDNITFNAIGEVDIMPMLPNDEMMLVNPEALISGDSIISVIKSCCPGIKRPEDLYYPDINTILLGIRKATYGNNMEQEYVCPECWKKKVEIEEKAILKNIENYKKENNVENVPEEVYVALRDEALKSVAAEITNMEKADKINIQLQKVEFNTDDILNRLTLMPSPSSSFIETNDHLKIFVAPYKCENKIKFINREIKSKKILKYLEDNKAKLELNSEITDEYLDVLSGIKNRYLDLSNISVDIISSCIRYIQLPSGELVTNPEYINQYVKSISSEITNEVLTKIEELNSCGIQEIIPVECACCKHKWDEKFYGFNQNDFFGIGS